MRAVRQAFKENGLAPRDMIDVQSALWVVHNNKDEDSDAVVKPPHNQWVFPAEDAERLMEKIENSIPQNLVMKFLGCTITQVERLVRNDFIRSITPISEGQVGQMRGNFNRDDLSSFLDQICRDLPAVPTETEGYVSLSGASRMRTDTGQVMGWFLDGKLTKTFLLHGVKRLDHLRFCRAEVTGQIEEAQDHDYHRLFSVSLMLGASLTAIKRLTSRENGAPLLIPVDPKKCKNLAGSAYVSAAEIERFKAKYLTSGLVGRKFGIHSSSALRALRQAGIERVADPMLLKTSVYRREDVLSVASIFAVDQSLLARNSTQTCQTMAEERTFGENSEIGESDASRIPAVKRSLHKNKGLGSKNVKVMLHYTFCVWRGLPAAPDKAGRYHRFLKFYDRGQYPISKWINAASHLSRENENASELAAKGFWPYWRYYEDCRFI